MKYVLLFVFIALAFVIFDRSLIPQETRIEAAVLLSVLIIGSLLLEYRGTH